VINAQRMLDTIPLPY